jgi:uncharacterized membrane protein
MTAPTVTLIRDVVVEVPQENLFGLCEAAESLPPLLADVVSVERTGEWSHCWRADLDGRRLVWETQAVHVDPPRRIEWRVRPAGDGKGLVGEVQLRRRPSGATEVRLALSCEGSFGLPLSDFARILDDNLESFKNWAESSVNRSPRGVEGRLDADRAASMADEGGAAAAEIAGRPSALRPR